MLCIYYVNIKYNLAYPMNTLIVYTNLFQLILQLCPFHWSSLTTVYLSSRYPTFWSHKWINPSIVKCGHYFILVTPSKLTSMLLFRVLISIVEYLFTFYS